MLIAKTAQSDALANFVHMIEVFIALQDERKANVLRLNYALYTLVTALHKRYPMWSVDELLSFCPGELIQLVEGDLPDNHRESIVARNAQCVWVGTLDWFAITTDADAVATVRRLLEHDRSESVAGYVAFKGNVRGTVRVILSEKDFGKMQEGDVLVTSMTRPEFLPVMRKASAYVTNEGGITCHAAIVARELQTPCIVGTRVATSVFHDGDLVEVDTARGTVSIVERKSS